MKLLLEEDRCVNEDERLEQTVSIIDMFGMNGTTFKIIMVFHQETSLDYSTDHQVVHVAQEVQPSLYQGLGQGSL